MFPKSRTLMERKIINHSKFYQTHDEGLCQIDISGGWPISEATCLTSAVGWSSLENQHPAGRGFIGHPSCRRQ